MNVLLISTLKREVTPTITASRSRIIYELASGLTKQGHKVSLLGTANSIIPGVRTIPVTEKAWVDLPPVENAYLREMSTLIELGKTAIKIQTDFDVIHSHTYPDFFIPLFENEFTKPLITTIHIQATDYVDEAFSYFKKAHLVSISKAHAQNFHKTNIGTVVYNGIDTDLYAFQEKKDDYLLWVGRLSKAKDAQGNFIDPKGIKWAIRLAQETNSRLLLSGNVEDMSFFNQDVKPHLNDKIRWIGEISSEQPLSKTEVVKLMQGAKAFLMTINWEEPFGLVMAEAMSCGTPVIAFNHGAIPEIVADGKTGFVVSPAEGINGLTHALQNINQINPQDCREHVLDHFSLYKMVANYETLYHQVQ